MFIDFVFFIFLGILAIPAICGYYAYTRGRSFWLWFLIGCVLPVISYFIIILLPDKSNPIEGALEDLRVQNKLLGTSPDIPSKDPLRMAVERTAIAHIAFEPILDTHPKRLKILINGVELSKLLHSFELPYARQENNKEWAGAYQGIPLTLALSPYKHFLGEPSRKFSIHGRPIVLEGGEQLPEELRNLWKWTVEIRFYRRVVVWHQMRQEARKNRWLYYNPELWVFNKMQYEEALQQLESCLS